MSAHDLVKTMIREVLYTTGITATGGIGTNLYLAKLAMDITANRVVKDEGIFQVDLFTDTSKLEKEKKLQDVMLGIKKKFGKNAVLKGTNYLDGATMRERNKTIGGHKAE